MEDKCIQILGKNEGRKEGRKEKNTCIGIPFFKNQEQGHLNSFEWQAAKGTGS
jgi:hypothetical protein